MGLAHMDSKREFRVSAVVSSSLGESKKINKKKLRFFESVCVSFKKNVVLNTYVCVS